MLGLLGLGLLGAGSQIAGQNAETRRQLGFIDQQQKILDEQLSEEQRAYRSALRSGGTGQGTGDFSRLRQKQFTGFI